MTNTAVSRRYEWQNKILRIIFSFFIAIGAVCNIAPFSVVYADSNYYLLQDTTITIPASFNSNPDVTVTKNSGSSPVYVYLAGVYNNNIISYAQFHFISDSPANITLNNYYGNYTFDLIYNSEYNKYLYILSTSGAWCDVDSNIKYVDISGLFNNGNAPSEQYVLKYILDNIYNPDEEIITYGSIKDLSYSTNIVGSGTASGDANIDTISWYPYWDNNSNISTTWNMQIQVVPGTWQGGTATDIFSQSYQNFIINESGALDIYRGTYLNGSFSISWGEIKNKLSILSWADLFQYFDGTYWNKKGWVYRARFYDPDNDYWSEWQTVYTVTSSNGEGVENIIDPSSGTGLGDFNNNVENSYNTTSVVNNSYNVTYYYNGIPVDTNVNDEEITDYTEKIYEVTKQIRDVLVNLNTTNSTTENNDNDETITNNLNSVVNDLHSTENQFMTDMDEKLTDIDNTFELLNNNKFIAAANWVRTQYDNIVLDTPFELLIVFALILSLALVIIGKVK